MKTKHFKSRHALLMSLTSLMLCVSMLFGATFAWFTDSVTSGVNRIVSGNLDVEVTHQTAGMSGAENVSSTTKLFTKDMNGDPLLWEPEVMAYETFTVSNKGTLNLKYEMHLNDVGENNLNGAKLADVIKVIVVDSINGRPAASEFANAPTLATFVQSKAFENSINADAADQSKTIVLYWPESDDDNDYNVNNGQTANDGKNHLYVDLGITLVATQETGEYDSFNDQYDATSTQPSDGWEGVSQASATATVGESGTATLTAGAAASSKTNNTTVEFAGITAEENAEVTLTVETSDLLTASGNFTATTDGDAVAVIDLSLTTTGSAEAATAATFSSAKVTTYITAGIDTTATPIVIQYTDPVNNTTETWSTTNGNADVDHGITYDSATGALTFKTTHFSKYVVYNNVVAYNANSDTVYTGLQKAINAAESGATVVLLKDVDANSNNSYIAINKSLTLDGNNHSITGSGKRGSANTTIAVNQGGTEWVDVTFKNLTVTNNKNYGRPIELRGKINSCTLDGVTLNANGGGNPQGLTVGGNQATAAKLIIKNSEINTLSSGYCIITFNPVDATISNSSFIGYGALYLKGVNDSAGSHGSIYNISNSIFSTPNSFTAESSSSFSLIPLEDYGNTINISNSTIGISTSNTGKQSIVSFNNCKNGYNNNGVGNNVITITNSTINMDGDNCCLTYNSGVVGDSIIIDGEMVYPVQSATEESVVAEE